MHHLVEYSQPVKTGNCEQLLNLNLSKAESKILDKSLRLYALVKL